MVSIQRIIILGFALLFTLGVVGQTASGDSMELSIQDALAKALEKNFDIKVQRLTLTSAEWGVKGAYGAYDPALTFDWGDTLSTQPVSSVIQSGASTLRDVSNHQYTYNLGISQATPWGRDSPLTGPTTGVEPTPSGPCSTPPTRAASNWAPAFPC